MAVVSLANYFTVIPISAETRALTYSWRRALNLTFPGPRSYNNSNPLTTGRVLCKDKITHEARHSEQFLEA